MQEQTCHNFYQEIESSFIYKPAFTLYKIFGEQEFSFEKAQYQSKVDWSGFYTQLSAQHSMRYLTKKWGDGSFMACLIKIQITNPNLTILTLKHKELANPKISGPAKAENIKRHLRKNYEQFKDMQMSKLISSLGQRNILVSCIDSQEEEIIIPHDLLHSKNFQYEQIAKFKCSSDGMLRTISFSKGKGWQKVPNQAQFQPYMLLQQHIWHQQ